MEFVIGTAALKRAVTFINVIRAGKDSKENQNDPDDVVIIEVYEDRVDFYARSKYGSISLSVKDSIDIVRTGKFSAEYDKLNSFLEPVKPTDSDGYGSDKFSFMSVSDRVEIRTRIKHNDNTYEDSFLSIHHFKGRIIKPEPFGKATFFIEYGTLMRTLNKVMFPVDISSHNKFSHVVKVCFSEGNNFLFVGANRSMLSEYRVAVNDINEGVIFLSYYFVNSLKKCKVDYSTNVLFEIEGNIVRAMFDDVCISGALIYECGFPDYEKHIPNYEKYLDVDRDSLLDSLSHVRKMSNKDDSYRVNLIIEDDVISLSTNIMKSRRKINTGHRGSLNIDFNGDNLIKALTSADSGLVRMCYTDSKKHVIFLAGKEFDQTILMAPLLQ